MGQEMIGKVIAQYRIVEALGQGGMGSVYKAHDTQLDRMVVLKLLSSELLGQENARKRFLREARLASALDHPNICMTYEIQESAGFYYISMQYIEGQTLKRAINSRPLAAPIFISIALQVADALATAHDHGIVHRDIKPQNIMITPRGQAKVLDFGLAKSLNDNSSISDNIELARSTAVAVASAPVAVDIKQADLTEQGETLGTPAYMSPEQARRERVDRRSDIFSFGVVLYEMATGRKPFAGKNNFEIVQAVCLEMPKQIGEFNRDAPPGLQEVLDRAIAKQPAKRYQSIQAMMADLKRLTAEGAAGLLVPDGIQKPFVPVERARAPWYERLLPKALRRANADASVAATLSNQSRAMTATLPPDDFPLIPGQYKTLAVLPFRNLGNMDNKWSLALLEAIITELTKFKSLNIRPSSYVAKYLNQEVNPADIGHALGVDAVMIGSFLESEHKVRVTAQLIDIASGGVLWGGKVDGSESDAIQLQDNICQQLVAELTGKQNDNSPFDLLRDESEEIRVDAVSNLKFSNDPKAIEALAEALADSSMRVKMCAAEALAHFGRSAAQPILQRLEEALRSRDFNTARFAAQAAGKLGSAEFVPILLDALACEDGMVASEAALALGKLNDTRAEAYLIEALARPDANVRFTCAQALGEIADPSSLEALEIRLREDEDEGVRAKAFWAIKHIRRSHSGVSINYQF